MLEQRIEGLKSPRVRFLVVFVQRTVKDGVILQDEIVMLVSQYRIYIHTLLLF